MNTIAAVIGHGPWRGARSVAPVPLVTLIRVGGVQPHGVLHVGVAVLSVQADLCRIDLASILRSAVPRSGRILSVPAASGA